MLLWLVPPLPLCCLTSPLSHSASTLQATKASEDPLTQSRVFLGDRPVELGAWWAAQQVQKSERANERVLLLLLLWLLRWLQAQAQCPNFFQLIAPHQNLANVNGHCCFLNFLSSLSSQPHLFLPPKTFIPSASTHSFHIRQYGRAHPWKACSGRRGSVSHFFTFRHLDL